LPYDKIKMATGFYHLANVDESIIAVLL